MSTDYKIGIVVGLVVLIAGIVYFLTSGEGDKLMPPVGPPAAGPNEVVTEPGQTPAGAPTEISLDTLTPQTQPSAVTPTSVVTPAETPTTSTATTGWQLDEDDDDAAVPAETPAGSETVKIRVPSEAEDGGFQLSEDADEAWSEPDLEPAPVAIRTIQPPPEEETAEPVVSAAGGTYTVKKGDNGYWIIAQRVYGPENGKYWTLIQKANPNADTNALREGQVLKIPPLPGGAGRTEETTRMTPSTAITRTGIERATTETEGNREYIVAEGDAGLWGIAEKMYGKGQLWEVIQKANPGVKPSALRVGMKLVIPPLPTATPRPGVVTPAGQTAATAPSGSARTRGAVFTENNRQYYIVQSGDAGYWGIARKVYGDGKYSYLIDRANSGVDSSSLQPGDKLVIPPIPAAGESTQPTRSIRPTPARVPARTPAPVRDGEPDFGP